MAKAEESKEPDEQRQRQKKTLVFDAEIPVSPLAEKRGDCGEERERERKEEKRRREERSLGIYAEATA